MSVLVNRNDYIEQMYTQMADLNAELAPEMLNQVKAKLAQLQEDVDDETWLTHKADFEKLLSKASQLDAS